MSQNRKLTRMARVNTVATKVLLMKRPSYFRCMKNSSTKVALIDAISIVIHILSPPQLYSRRRDSGRGKSQEYREHRQEVCVRLNIMIAVFRHPLPRHCRR